MQSQKLKHWPEIICTVVYLGGIGLYADFSFAKFQALKPNELGDFLAGAFAPLAFMWLAFGYFQQGKELQQQAEELRQSVEQQRELVDVTRQQYIHEKLINHRNAQPKFILTILNVITSNRYENETKYTRYSIQIKIDNMHIAVTHAKLNNLTGGWNANVNLGDIYYTSQEFELYRDNADIPTKASFDIEFIDGLRENSSCHFIIEYDANYQGDEKHKFKIIENITTV